MIGLADLFPSEVLGLVDSLGRQDAQVALFNLGYLSREQFGDPPALQRGVTLFRTDYQHVDQFSRGLYLPAGATGPLTGAEAALLQRLTGLEGDFMFDKLPQVGDSGLLSRVAGLRINLFRSPPSDSEVFSSSDLDFLAALADWPGCVPAALAGRQARALAALNGAGDPAELIRRVWKGLLSGAISYFHSDVEPHKPAVTPRFRSALRASLGANDPAYLEFVQHVPSPPQPVDTRFMAARVRDPRNLLALRFAQILAWIDGYYQGSIDETFGPVTRSAIEARMADDRRADRKNGPNPCYAFVAHGFWAFNHVLFFSRMFEPDAGKAVDRNEAEAVVFTQLEQAYARLSPGRKTEAQLNMLKLALDLVKPAPALAADRPGQGGFWFSGFRRIAEWFRNLFRRFFKELRNPAASRRCGIVALGLFKRLGEALYLLGRGIAYLDGPRELFVPTSDGKEIAACTRFGRDFDCMSFIAATITSDELEEHQQRCVLFSRALSVLFGFTAVVVRVVLAAGRLSWLGLSLLILRIYTRLRDIIDDVISGPTAAITGVRRSSFPAYIAGSTPRRSRMRQSLLG